MLDPECMFTAKMSKNLLARIKLNLIKMCEVDDVSSNVMDLLKWKSKFVAQVCKLCQIEIV